MTRQHVIRRLVERELHGESLLEPAVLRDDAALHTSACEHFGTWETALEYAGIDVRRALRRAADEQTTVVCRLRYMCSGMYCLSPQRVRAGQPRLYRLALEQFGTWERALQAAGIDPAHIQQYRAEQIPDRQQVLELIAQRRSAGHSLRWGDIARENQALAKVVKRLFGTWQKALVAAGVAAPNSKCRRSRTWNEQRVMEALRAWHETQHENSPRGLWTQEPRLAAAARRYFGSLAAAHAAAGVPRRGRRTKPE